VAAKVALSRIDVAEGHPERAQRELDRIERSVKLAEVAEGLAEVFTASRFNERAKWWFTEALRRDPLLIVARLRLARLEREAGRLDGARAELDKLLKLNPQYLPARREQAQLLLETGELQAARELFDQLASEADDAETLMGAARAHLYLGEGANAEQRLKKAQSIGVAGPVLEELNDLTARSLLLQHRPEEAIALLKKLAPSAQRAETGALLMHAYLDLDQQDNAAKVKLYLSPRLRGSVEVQTESARLQVERGRDVLGEALATDAIQRMTPRRNGAPLSERTIARRWVKAEALIALGRSQYDQGMFRPALKSLKSASELDPTSARAFYHYALVLEEIRRVTEAREAMEQAVKIDPRYPDALYNLGRMRSDANDPKALDPYVKYLEVASKGIYANEARKALEGRPTAKRRRHRAR
jgi:tetratricopeptide (TPR) repeat protein